MLIDTHSHLNFNAFKNDVFEVIKRTLDNKIWIINVGTNFETSKRAVDITKNYNQGVYAAIGLHPIHLEKTKVDKSEISFEKGCKIQAEEFDYEKYKTLALKNKKVVAIGEIGLDYWNKPKNRERLEIFKKKQKETFIQQIDLAEELNLPVIIHCRTAHDDLLKILNSKFQSSNFKMQGVVHCFTGNWSQAQKFLDMGFYLGFNGIIFKLNLNEIIKKIPNERILIETDCPYLAPPPFQNQRNEPLYLSYIVKRIAEVKGLSNEEVEKITTENAVNLFKLT